MTIRRVDKPAPGIHRVEVALDDRFVACYVLVGRQRVAIVDTGTAQDGPRDILDYLDQVRVDRERVTTVIATHADFDHFGGNGVLAAHLPAARFLCHPADAHLIRDVDALMSARYAEFGPEHGIPVDQATESWIRRQVSPGRLDGFVVDHQRIELDAGWTVRVLHVPGHSDGHVAVLDPRSGSVILGDALMGRGLVTADGDLRYPPTYRRVRDQAGTIRRLRAIAPRQLLTAHYPIMDATAGQAFVEESHQFAVMLEREIVGELEAAGAAGLSTLVQRLNPRVGSWPDDAWDDLAFPVMGHLEALEERGVVTRLPETDGLPRWSLTQR